MNNLKVFKLNEYEWYCAENLESAIQFAMELTGCSRDEVAEDPSECDLNNNYMLWGEEPEKMTTEEKQLNRITFREAIERYIEEGEKAPFFFAWY